MRLHNGFGRAVGSVLFAITLVAAVGVGVSGGRAAGIAGGGAAGAPLRKIAEVELPGPPGQRFDYLTIDEDDNYLLSAHLGVPGVEGVAYIPEGRKAYTAHPGRDRSSHGHRR